MYLNFYILIIIILNKKSKFFDQNDKSCKILESNYECKGMKLILFFLGASIGSFLALVAERYPNESLLHPRSHCQQCQHSLAFIDLVPLLSALILRFRCRHCRQRFSAASFHMEWTSGLLFLLLPPTPSHLPTHILLLMGQLLSLFDLKSYAYPFSYWLFFQPYFWWTFGISWTYLAWCSLAILFYRVSLGVGEGDALYLATASYLISLDMWPCLFLVASLIGLGWAWLKKTDRVPFVPCLHLAVCLLTMQ